MVVFLKDTFPLKPLMKWYVFFISIYKISLKSDWASCFHIYQNYFIVSQLDKFNGLLTAISVPTCFHTGPLSKMLSELPLLESIYYIIMSLLFKRSFRSLWSLRKNFKIFSMSHLFKICTYTTASTSTFQNPYT